MKPSNIFKETSKMLVFLKNCKGKNHFGSILACTSKGRKQY